MEKKRLIQVINLPEAKDDFINYVMNHDPHHRKVKEYGDCYSEITKTTYYYEQYDTKLVDLYFKHFFPVMQSLVGDNFLLNSIWYQIYNKESGSHHRYHTHDNMFTHVSAVYYAKLSDSKMATIFKVDGEEYQPDAKEGDLVVFDSRIPHTSPPNTSKKDKISIAFNLNLGL